MDRRWVHIEREVLRAQIVVPADEEDRHILTSRYCRCNVRVYDRNGWTHYIHMALDHREVDEYFEAKRQN